MKKKTTFCAAVHVQLIFYYKFYNLKIVICICISKTLKNFLCIKNFLNKT